MKSDITLNMELSTGVSAQLVGEFLVVKGPKGEVKININYPGVEVLTEQDKVVLKALKATKREKTVMGSFQSHINSAIKGVQEEFVYKVKICSGHFPMNVSISGKELTIKNFLGEAVPRKVRLLDGAKVKVNGAEIEIVSPDKGIAGQVAGQIEQLCRITNRDKRIFQDGCYIIHKAGKDI
jgi:large subunit ribosomal protein L6